MKGERILVADDDDSSLSRIVMVIDRMGEGADLLVIATATNVEEVQGLVEGGLRPTLAIVDNRFPREGDGNRAKEIIKKYSPKTKVASFSTDKNVGWGDENWLKELSPSEIIQKIVELQH